MAAHELLRGLEREQLPAVEDPDSVGERLGLGEVVGAEENRRLVRLPDLAEAEALADRVGILDRGELLALEPADELMCRYDAATLEEAFFAATGRSFVQEADEEDAERSVFA